MTAVTVHERLSPATATAVAALWSRIDTALIGHADFITTADELLPLSGIRDAEQQVLVTAAGRQRGHS